MPGDEAAGARSVVLPRAVLDRTLAALREQGDRGLESHALWVGRMRDGAFTVVDAWFPRQRRTFCSYTVSEADEFRVNVRLNAAGLVAMCQVHTHPAAAYHSPIDDEGSALSLPGSLSVVVPNYGRVRGGGLSGCAVYKYDGGRWIAMPSSEVKRAFQVT